MQNYTVTIEENGSSIFQRYYQTDDIKKVVKGLMKEREYKLKPKGYSTAEYAHLRPIYRTWECTKGIVIFAHEVYV